MLSFELRMPRIGSWNGKWSGSENEYFLIKSLNRKKEVELNGKRFYYDFGDGWTASITVEKITAKEAAQRRKRSRGFYGYNWMVSEILDHGRILTLAERKNRQV